MFLSFYLLQYCLETSIITSSPPNSFATSALEITSALYSNKSDDNIIANVITSTTNEYNSYSYDINTDSYLNPTTSRIIHISNKRLFLYY